MMINDLPKSDIIKMYWAQVRKNRDLEAADGGADGGEDGGEDGGGGGGGGADGGGGGGGGGGGAHLNNLHDYNKYTGKLINLEYQIKKLSQNISKYKEFYSNIIHEGKIVELNNNSHSGFIKMTNKGFSKTISFDIKYSPFNYDDLFIGEKVYFKIINFNAEIVETDSNDNISIYESIIYETKKLNCTAFYGLPKKNEIVCRFHKNLMKYYILEENSLKTENGKTKYICSLLDYKKIDEIYKFYRTKTKETLVGKNVLKLTKKV